MTIKHISFDVWNTLIEANPAYALARNAIIADYAFTTKERAAAIYKEVKKELDADAERGVCGNTADAWVKLGKALGMSLMSVSAMQRDCIEAFEEFPPFFNPDLRQVLCELNFFYDLSIKSNTNFIPGSVVAKAAGLNDVPFMFKHFSDTYQMCKPDPRFFLLTLDEKGMYDVEPGEILHVGDNMVCDLKCVDAGFNFWYVSSPQDLLNNLEQGAL